MVAVAKEEKTEEKSKSKSLPKTLPNNWQLQEPGKMVETLLDAYHGAKDEALTMLKQECNKVKRMVNSGRVHNMRLAERKLSRMERARSQIMGS